VSVRSDIREQYARQEARAPDMQLASAERGLIPTVTGLVKLLQLEPTKDPEVFADNHQAADNTFYARHRG
jgi:hypothetical protein